MGKITVKEEDTQTTPSTGYNKLYPKSDGKWYYKDDSGVEKEISTADHPVPAHASTHKGDGADAIDVATASVDGLMSSTDKTKIDTIASNADVTGSNAPQAHAASHKGDGADAIAIATTSVAGLLSSSDKTKLDAVNPGGAPVAHKASHEDSGADEISVAGLSGVLADRQDANKLLGKTIEVTTPTRRNFMVYDEINDKWINQKLISVPYGTVVSRDFSPTWADIENYYKFIPVNTEPSVTSHVGNGTVSYLNGISGVTGDTYVVTDSGTLTAGSLAVTPGTLVMWYISAWVLAALPGDAGHVVGGLMVQLSTTTALISPYTDGTDDGKLIGFDGTDSTGAETSQDITITLPDPTGLPFNDGLIKGMFYVGKMSTTGTVSVVCAGTPATFMDGVDSVLITGKMQQATLAVVNASLAATWMRISQILDVLQIRRSATWAATNFATAASIPFDTEDEAGNPDISDWISGTNPERVTIHADGIYKINGHMSFDYTGQGEYAVTAYLTKDGTEIPGTRIEGGSYKSSTAITLDMITVTLSDEEYIEWKVIHSGFVGNLDSATLVVSRSY